jgi:Ca-activated chloride channel family protein
MVGFQDFHFLRPLWLLALIFPFVWSWFVYRNERIQSSWAEVCDEHLLKFLLIKGDNQQRRLPYVFAVLFMVFAILALAGPTWVKKPNPSLSVDNPVMFALNLSSDMEQRDVAPNRLTRARYTIKEFMRTLHSTETGLIVYSDEPFMISPLTEDTALIDNLLPEVERKIMPANGDRLDRAIDMAVERMQKIGYTKGNVIVITADVGERFDRALQSAEAAHQKGFDVNVIKVSGTDNDKLQMVAQKGGGVYLNYNQDYAPLSHKVNDLYAKELNESKNMQETWLDFGYYLFWLPALLLLYYYRRGVIVVLLLCLFCTEAYAGWFLNDNQEAMRYFKRGQYNKATQMFKSPQWRGAAAYKGGDFATALREFSQFDDVTSLYNQGNALAKSGKIDEAIAKYEEVLKQQPDFEDAKFNLEYLKNMKKNQNQKDNQKQDDKQDQDKNEKSGGQDEQKNNQQQQDKQDQQKQQEEQSEQQDKQEQEQKQEQKQQDKQQSDQQKQQEQQQNNSKQEQSEQNQEQQQDQQEQSEQNQEQQQKQDGNQQESEQQSSENNEQSADNSQAEQKPQDNAEQNKDESANDEQSQEQNTPQKTDKDNQPEEEQETEQQVQTGNPDENGKEAETLDIQNGDKAADDKDKIRARLQRFRDIPEDKGGLLRALIAKEYSKNRYKDE